MRIRKLRMRASILGITGLLLFVGLWKASGMLGWVRQGTMPDPFLVPGAFFDELESGRLWPAIASSLIHYCWGLSIGTFTGIAVGGFAATQRLFDELHAWLARILRPIPVGLGCVCHCVVSGQPCRSRICHLYRCVLGQLLCHLQCH